MTYVGSGSGSYLQDKSMRFVGHGGDYDVLRRKKDYTCVIMCCCLLSLPLLISLLWWLLSPAGPAFDCMHQVDTWEDDWS